MSRHPMRRGAVPLRRFQSDKANETANETGTPMANFILAIDPNTEQRSRFITATMPHLSPVSGLSIQSCQQGCFQAAWAAHSQAPISIKTASTDDTADTTLLWGEALDLRALSASELSENWRHEPKQCPIFDGFYAAARYHPQQGLRVGCDVLGLFPIYYTYLQGRSEPVLLVSSSPQLFQSHPLFQSNLDTQGLTGLLLTNGLLNNHTLWQGVSRLAPRHLLLWQVGQPPTEIEQYALPTPASSTSLSPKEQTFKEQINQLDSTLNRVFQRHAPTGQKHAMLLSGGLDSRLLSGLLSRHGHSPAAITFGRRSDFEMTCARAVSKHLDWQHYSLTSDPSQAARYARTAVNYEHLANGFNGVDYWSIHDHYNQLETLPLPRRILTGHILEAPIGTKVGGLLPAQSSFEQCFDRVTQWGFSPAVLEDLLRPDVFGEEAQVATGHLKNAYHSAAPSSSTEFHRDLYFDLTHRQRFHVGATAWRLSFSAWPVLPVLDREVLAIPAQYPIHTLLQRRAQRALVAQQFPSLAVLPLDSNGFKTTPLSPTAYYKRLAPLYELQRKWRRLQFKLGRDRRYFYRTYSLNSPFWQTIRQAAEPQRENLHSLFRPDVLMKLLPPPHLPITYTGNSIPASSSIKLLLALMLWSENNAF